MKNDRLNVNACLNDFTIISLLSEKYFRNFALHGAIIELSMQQNEPFRYLMYVITEKQNTPAWNKKEVHNYGNTD